MSLHYADITVQHREVLLRNKPPSMLAASAKGTVPVLKLPGGKVIDESAEIMKWAIDQRDPDCWWNDRFEVETNSLIDANDFDFKTHLDRYKYADRFPEHPQSFYRSKAETFLHKLEQRLQRRRYLVCDHLTFSDVAIFPFIRQFAFVDKDWFDRAPYPRLQSWLQCLLNSDLFSDVMEKHPIWTEDQVHE